MAQKAMQSNSSSSLVPVVLFGVDQNGKPKAARFVEKHAQLAAKAAGHLNLRVLQVTAPGLAELADRLPVGRIHANGRGFVPYIRRDLYAKLLAAAATPPTSQPNGQITFPKNWDEIAPGNVVIVEEGPFEGWYEAIVEEINGELLTMRWLDYPRERRRITRHRPTVALLYPHVRTL